MAKKYEISTQFKAIDKMTAPIGKMQARIGRMTASAEMGMRKLDGGMTRITKGFAAIGAAGIAGIVGINAALTSLGGDLDVLAKTARRLDMPIEDLQTFRFIGEQSGLSINEMDKALGTFTKRLGESKSGIGALSSGLKKTHPELLKQLNAAGSISEAFDIYTNALRNSKDPAEQAALASAAYSKSGMKLIQISHNSADAIKDMTKQARENGLVTQKQAEDAEAYNDAQNRMNKTLSGFMTSILVPLYPLMTQLTDKVRDWGVANREVVASRVVEYATKFIDVVKQYAPYVPVVLKFVGAFILLNGALKVTIGVMTALNLIMAANPATLVVMAIVAALAALSAAAVAVYANWDEIKAYFVELGGFIKDIFNDFIEVWLYVFGFSPLGMIINNWGGITDYFKDLFSGIVDIYENTLGAVMRGIESARSWLFDDDINVNGNNSVSYDNVVTPQDRISKTIQESRETYDINVRADAGSYVTSYSKPNGRLNLMNSGS